LVVRGEAIVFHFAIQTIPMVPHLRKIDDRLGYVTNIYTSPEYRNRGVGRGDETGEGVSARAASGIVHRLAERSRRHLLRSRRIHGG